MRTVFSDYTLSLFTPRFVAAGRFLVKNVSNFVLCFIFDNVR